MSANLSLHRQMFSTVENRDFAALRELYHPDYTYTGGDGVEQKGADAGVAVAETYTAAFPDLTFEYRHQFAVDEVTSVIEFTARGTHQGALDDIPPTGKSVELVVCNVVETRDGKIHREREYYDTLAVLTQLGVAPAG